MEKLLLRSIALIALTAAGTANAADMAPTPIFQSPPPPPAPMWNWAGGYVGVHLGGLWGDTNFSDPFGTSIFGDKVATPGFLGGLQTGYNWQAPHARWLFGVEADLSALASTGTNTCLAFSGNFLSANCRSTPNASSTLTARAGYVIDPEKRTLFYLKGGAAALHDKIGMAINALVSPPVETSNSTWKLGWTVGAGVERALTPAWSLRFEYDYLAFGHSSVATPASFLQVIPGDPAGYIPTAGATASVSQSIQEVKAGLNYRFDMDPSAYWTADGSAPADYQLTAAAIPRLGGWEFETGARYWFSSGKFQKDLGATTAATTANVLVSRLTYDSIANSGEVFARAESPDKLFVKGFIGAGGLAGGHMNDEDWAAFGGAVAYSNTISNPVKGTISYATVDVGYDIFRAADYKLGSFVGYNYYREKEDAYGCVQIANPFSDCIPAIPSSVLGITEDDTWNSLRVGLNGEVIVLPGLSLSADAAYLPYTTFKGMDIHWLRTDVIDQSSPESGRGSGVQLDAILSYYITPAFSVGVGGRYWAMWTSDSAYTVIFGTPCPCQTEPAKTERYGLLLQADYKFDMPAALAAR
jgi:opacity protein-like surface antigen/outer membrane protease